MSRSRLCKDDSESNIPNAPTSQSSDQNQPFTLFRNLPPEIRAIIWEFAMPPRIIYLQEGITPLTYSPVPAILHINHESRTAALKHYTHVRTTDGCAYLGSALPEDIYLHAREDYFVFPFETFTGWRPSMWHVAPEICCSITQLVLFRRNVAGLMRKWETYGLEDDEWDEDDPVFENYFPVVDTLLVIVNDEKYEEESLEGGCAGLRVVEEVDVPGMEIGELRKRCEELKISVWFVEAL